DGDLGWWPVAQYRQQGDGRVVASALVDRRFAAFGNQIQNNIAARGLRSAKIKSTISPSFCLSQLLGFAYARGPKGDGGTCERTTSYLDLAPDANSSRYWAAQATEPSYRQQHRGYVGSVHLEHIRSPHSKTLRRILPKMAPCGQGSVTHFAVRRETHGMSPPGRFCCKSLFALTIKNSAGCRQDFCVKMWGTSSPDDKLTGDLGNVIETTQIGGRRAGRLSAGEILITEIFVFFKKKTKEGN